MRFILLTFVLSFLFETRKKLPACPALSNPPPTTTIDRFVRINFDYVIIGGGTAGMVLASRLAEGGKLTVGVLEAGSFLRDDPIVNVPAFVGRGSGNTTYDWNFQSVPQKHASGRILPVSRGKMLGGSSGLNGMAWNRASAIEYDSWKNFAPNNDWSWRGLLDFFKKSEHVVQFPQDPFPDYSESIKDATFDLSLVTGFSGPMVATYNALYMNVVPPFVRALNALGIATNSNPHGGNATGIYNTLMVIDRSSGARGYSAQEYYCLMPERKNLHVLVGAQATKILFSSLHSDVPIATSVQFKVGSSTYVVNATKEIIISAGAVQTPQLLELSGIGNPDILSAAGIPTLVNISSVGENLQEHAFVAVQWLLKPGSQTFDIMRNNATFAAEQTQLYNTKKTGFLAALDNTICFLPLQSVVDNQRLDYLLKVLSDEAKGTPLSSLRASQYLIERSWIEQGQVAQVELIEWSRGLIFPQANQSYVTVIGGLSHATSRGHIHITSGNPLQPPEIDFNFLERDFDIQVLLDVLKYVQKIGRVSPFADIIASQTFPSPLNQSDADLIQYIRNGVTGGAHLIGTAAMAPRERGGVVDSSLRVYGTSHLRVVDASIFPTHLSAHIQATVFAIAEKMAVMIKNDM